MISSKQFINICLKLKIFTDEKIQQFIGKKCGKLLVILYFS